MFARFFIDRPIFASTLSIVIVLIGGLAFTSLPIAQYPEISPPTISVTASFPGADAQTVAETVAQPIEQQVNGVERMMYMESKSTNDGQMNLTITFEVGTDLDMAQVLVQNRVALATPKLPEEVKRVGLSTKKQSPSIILCVNLFSPDGKYDQLYMSNYASIQVKDAINRIGGVGNVLLIGEREYSMRLWVNPELAAARGITVGDVIAAIQEQNVQVAAGRLGQSPLDESTAFQYTLRCRGRLLTPEEFGAVIVKTADDGGVTQLRDIAKVELGAKGYEMSCTLSAKKDDLAKNGDPEHAKERIEVPADLEGIPTVMLAVYQRPGSNAVQTAIDIRNTMEDLAKNFPPGLNYIIAHDTTPFINESIHEVYNAFRDAIILVALVVLVFLQNWRSALIPLIAVPVALIGTFAMMSLLGFSLNNLSLFGLVLAIGIVVDDAIVVVENVEHHMEHGLSPREASYRAMAEVSGPVIAVSLVLCAVFIPTAFISGISGQFYRQFALTIAVSTVISAFNSLTLSPALAAILLRPKGTARDPLTRLLDTTLGWFFRLFNGFFRVTTAGYVGMVRVLLRGSVFVLLLYAGLLYATGQIFMLVPQGFIPSQDKGYLLMNVQLPDASSLDRTQSAMRQVEQQVRKTESVRYVLGIEGMSVVSGTNASNCGTFFVILDPFEKRHGRSAEKIRDEILMATSDIQDAYIGAYGAPPVDGLGSAGGFKLQIQDRGGAGLDSLQATVDQMVETGRKTGKLVGLYTPMRSNTPQMVIEPDRERAKRMGVAFSDISTTLQGYLGSVYVNDFSEFGRNYQVTLQADLRYRSYVEDVFRLQTRNRHGEMVPLSSVLSVRNTTGPMSVDHYNMFPAAALSGDTVPGVSTGDAIALVKEIADRDMPSEFGFSWTELTYLQITAGNTTMLVFGLAVVLVFLVLAAQYESWSLPLAVILVVPMCILCSLTGVMIMGLDMNIFTQIGFVVLVGLASKNAILIVEFAKMKQETPGEDGQVMSALDATLEACRLRLRPIIMTSLAFILGVVPLVLASGAGAEMRVTLGIAVFSGMLGVTFFGIFLTPVFYYVIRKIVNRQHTGAASR